VKVSLSLSLSVSLSLLSLPALAYCPCYSSESTHNTYNCGVPAAPGTNPTTAQWQPIFDLVSQGPAVWGSQGPSVGNIGQGCGHPETLHSVAARFPCELLKAIAMAESGWTQFCVPDQPADEVGGASRTIISFDCGYGVGQVTSGMHAGETPSFDRDRVAGDATYNLATGTQILAGKWKATECVGDNQPAVIEDWYIATWAYNGLAYSNNPNNPNYDPGRGVWDPAVGGSAPYQEKVFGRIEHTNGKWTPTALAYPNPGDCGTGGNPPALPEPDCASPTDCGNKRSVHTTICTGGTGGTGGTGTGGSTGTTTTSTSITSTGSGGAGGSTELPDGGTEPDAGGGKDAGGKDAGSDGGTGETEDKGGCGCRAAGEGGAEGGWALALIGAAIAARRRRR
jgi:MYXO-CTERM domain-containing protein